MSERTNYHRGKGITMNSSIDLTHFFKSEKKFCYLPTSEISVICAPVHSAFSNFIFFWWQRLGFKTKFFAIVLGNSASNKSSILTYIVGNNFSRMSWHLLQEVSSLKLGTLLNNCLHRYPTETLQLIRKQLLSVSVASKISDKITALE